jgi:hypothetical protein
LVAAYIVAGLCGSIESARIGPPSGPTFAHTLVPAQSVPGTVPTRVGNAIKAIFLLTRSTVLKTFI